MRLAAGRELDRRLRPALAPWDYGKPLIDYSAVHLDKTLAERDAIGRQLAEVP